ncbi:MAG TPA: phosphatase PAP2 family protein [Streptosporangiaceae bacterium]
MELTGIIAGLLLAVGAAVILASLALRAWTARSFAVPGVVRQLTGRIGQGASALALRLILGLAAVTVAGVAVGALVDDVTEGDGVAVLDHPVARFVDAHRSATLTTVMKAVSAAGGPAGMSILALGAGLILWLTWRSWTPLVVLAVTAAGVAGLTVVFKEVLGRSRPPLAQAVAAADGFAFPSGHAAAAAAVCGAAAWLCGLRIRSWLGRTLVWAAAAMLAALVGISRVYLGVHWTSDVLGGWAVGVLWMAVVVSGWTAHIRRVSSSRGSSAAC